jgi:hemolysin activation/secretion protein
MRLGSIHLGLSVLALTVTLPAVAMAQSSAPTREELDPSRAVGPAQAAPSRLSVDGDIERGPCPLADPAYAALNVTFSRIDFANLTAVPAGTLDDAWQDMAGREVPIASLCEVRDRAATMLRSMGYLAAVQVPPQRIEKNGVVRMDVLVAKLVEVQVRGDAGHSEKLIAAHLNALTRQPFFNVNTAERHLLLARDLPGFDVRMTLRSARGAPGEVVGDVVVTRRPVELIVSAQNLGSKATGREGLFAQLTLNDLTGMGDRTSLSIYNTVQTREQTVLQLSHDFALGSDGLRFGGRLIYGTSKPDVTGGAFKSRSLIGQAAFTYPLLRRQAMTLGSSAGLEIINQSVDFGATRLNQDRLRVLFARLDYDRIDADSLASRNGYTASEPRLRIGGSLEARQGLGGLGASKGCTPIANCIAPNVPISNFFADPSAFVVRLQSSFEFRPVPIVTIALAPRAQYSGAQLLGYEQFSLGNYTIGRGVDPGIVQGDSGIGTSLELRVGRLTPKSADALTFQPFVFLDAAWAWVNDNGVTANPLKVYSAGGGIRARWGDHADINLTVAAPLRRAGFQTARGDVRVLFTITSRLLPWNPS